MAKKKPVKRARSTSEKVMIILSIIIALSMILGLVVGLSGRGRGSTTTTNTSQLAPDESTLVSRVVSVVVDSTAVAVLVEDLAPPGGLA